METFTDQIETTYPFSSNLEFYFYRIPVVVKVEPLSGLVSGNTLVTVSGAWFQNLPEYGVVPFCKFGDEINRATFVQTNRILCRSPPSDDT